jgi:hypothetical protein
LSRERRAFSQPPQFLIGTHGAFAVNRVSTQGGFRISRGAQLDLLGVHFARRFDLMRIDR